MWDIKTDFVLPDSDLKQFIAAHPAVPIHTKICQGYKIGYSHNAQDSLGDVAVTSYNRFGQRVSTQLYVPNPSYDFDEVVRRNKRHAQ